MTIKQIVANMQTVSLLLATVFLVSYSLPSALAYSDPNSEATLAKKSLCNTFTGCGKRSVYVVPPREQLQQQRPINYDSSLSKIYLPPPPLVNNNRDNSKLISEVLTDLAEYIKANNQHNNKQAKYSVLVPRSYYDSIQGLPAASNNDFQNDEWLKSLPNGMLLSPQEN